MEQVFEDFGHKRRCRTHGGADCFTCPTFAWLCNGGMAAVGVVDGDGERVIAADPRRYGLPFTMKPPPLKNADQGGRWWCPSFPSIVPGVGRTAVAPVDRGGVVASLDRRPRRRQRPPRSRPARVSPLGSRRQTPCATKFVGVRPDVRMGRSRWPGCRRGRRS